MKGIPSLFHWLSSASSEVSDKHTAFAKLDLMNSRKIPPNLAWKNKKNLKDNEKHMLFYQTFHYRMVLFCFHDLFI